MNCPAPSPIILPLRKKIPTFIVLPLDQLRRDHYHYPPHLSDSSVAQSVEQVAVNHWVTGSSPVRGAIFP